MHKKTQQFPKISELNSSKKDLSTLPLTPPEHSTNFWKLKMKHHHLNTQTIHCISSTYFFHQVFILSEIWNNSCDQIPNFWPSQLECFDLKNFVFVALFSSLKIQLPSTVQPPQFPQISWTAGYNWVGWGQGWMMVMTGAWVHTPLKCRKALSLKKEQWRLFVRSPFRAKHHVVVQYVARWMKCPLPSSPAPAQPSAPGPPPVEDKEDKEELATLPARDFALQLPWALLLICVLLSASCWRLIHHGVLVSSTLISDYWSSPNQ